MKLSPLALASVLLHFYIGVRLVPGLGAYPAGQWAVVAVMLASALLMPMGMIARRLAKPPLSDVLSWAGLLCMGLFSSLFVLTLLRDIALLLLLLGDLLVPGYLPMAAVVDVSAQAVLLLGLLVTVIGFVSARRTASVVKVDIPIKGLPSALVGFTVAQISDIHMGLTIGPSYLHRIVDKVNLLDADMVAITGDLVDGQVSELAGHVAPLSRLRSRHGTYFVTGNHEYYSGAHAWIVELRRLGLTVLMNEHVVLHHGHSTRRGASSSDAQDDSQIMAPLVLAGVTDYSAHHFDPSHRSDPHAALEGAPMVAPVRLLLAHQPRSAVAAAEAGFDLQLSGHTHGGQFYPWNLFVRFQQPFTAGLHRMQNLWVYTSRGTGYWGPPKRFGVPSEISLVRLVAG